MDSFGRLGIADTLNHRALLYSNPSSSGAPDFVWGQNGNSSSNLANLGLASPERQFPAGPCWRLLLVATGKKSGSPTPATTACLATA